MNQKFIDGIFNYCDRWCERCTFTNYCRNYESTSKLHPTQLDIRNKAFWKNFSSNFEQAIKLLYKMAEERGIDLDSISPEEAKAYEERQSFIEETTRTHVLIKLCKQYEQTAIPFIEGSVSGELVDKTRNLVSQLHMGMKTAENVVDTMAGLGDCDEIIRGYLFFIDAKLQRALRGKMEGEEWVQVNEYQKDSDGSAKIAMIAIERSMAAWIRMYELLPGSEDVALNALSLLSQLRQKALEEFPQAMNFKRPGFDD
jgi:hypothetical protein